MKNTPPDELALARRMADRDALEKEILRKRELRSRQYQADLAADLETEAHAFPAQVSIHDS